MRIFIDMDGTLAKWGTIESNEELYRKDYYKNLEPNYDILIDVKRLICDNENVYILSHYLTDSNGSKNICLNSINRNVYLFPTVQARLHSLMKTTVQ